MAAVCPKGPRITCGRYIQHYSESGDVIGAGSYGSIRPVTLKGGSQSNSLVVKTMESKFLNDILSEIYTYSTFRHSYLSSAHDIYIDYNIEKHQVEADIVMDRGESFSKHIEEGIPLHQALKYSYMMLDVLSFLHSHRIIHADIKAGNMIYFPSKDIVRLTDFGLIYRVGCGDPDPGQTYGDLGAYQSRGGIILRDYSSERVRGNTAKVRYDPVASAVWAMGVTILEMIMGGPPINFEDLVIQDKNFGVPLSIYILAQHPEMYILEYMNKFAPQLLREQQKANTLSSLLKFLVRFFAPYPGSWASTVKTDLFKKGIRRYTSFDEILSQDIFDTTREVYGRAEGKYKTAHHPIRYPHLSAVISQGLRFAFDSPYPDPNKFMYAEYWARYSMGMALGINFDYKMNPRAVDTIIRSKKRQENLQYLMNACELLGNYILSQNLEPNSVPDVLYEMDLGSSDKKAVFKWLCKLIKQMKGRIMIHNPYFDDAFQSSIETYKDMKEWFNKEISDPKEPKTDNIRYNEAMNKLAHDNMKLKAEGKSVQSVKPSILKRNVKDVSPSYLSVAGLASPSAGFFERSL